MTIKAGEKVTFAYPAGSSLHNVTFPNAPKPALCPQTKVADDPVPGPGQRAADARLRPARAGRATARSPPGDVHVRLLHAPGDDRHGRRRGRRRADADADRHTDGDADGHRDAHGHADGALRDRRARRSALTGQELVPGRRAVTWPTTRSRSTRARRSTSATRRARAPTSCSPPRRPPACSGPASPSPRRRRCLPSRSRRGGAASAFDRPASTVVPDAPDRDDGLGGGPQRRRHGADAVPTTSPTATPTPRPARAARTPRRRRWPRLWAAIDAPAVKAMTVSSFLKGKLKIGPLRLGRLGHADPDGLEGCRQADRAQGHQARPAKATCDGHGRFTVKVKPNDAPRRRWRTGEAR